MSEKEKLVREQLFVTERQRTYLENLSVKMFGRINKSQALRYVLNKEINKEK